METNVAEESGTEGCPNHGRGGVTAAIELLYTRMEVSEGDKLTAELRGQGSSGSKGTLLAGVGHGKDGGSVAG